MMASKVSFQTKRLFASRILHVKKSLAGKMALTAVLTSLVSIKERKMDEK